MEQMGWIYIIGNELRDGHSMFKVGRTSNLEDRLASLNSETGSYGKYEQIAKFFVSDMVKAEAACFKELDDYRIHPNREIFRTSKGKIVNIVKNVVSNYKPVDEFPEFKQVVVEGAIFIFYEFDSDELEVTGVAEPSWEMDDIFEGERVKHEQFGKFYVSDILAACTHCRSELGPYIVEPYIDREDPPQNINQGEFEGNFYEKWNINAFCDLGDLDEIIRIVAKVASNYTVENKPPELRRKVFFEDKTYDSEDFGKSTLIPKSTQEIFKKSTLIPRATREGSSFSGITTKYIVGSAKFISPFFIVLLAIGFATLLFAYFLQ